MAPVVRASGDAYERLRNRALTAIELCQESRTVDFKSSQPWDVLKPILIKAALGMSNLRDGGIVVIGIEETRTAWNRTGIAPDHLATYDPDICIDQISLFASPSVQMTFALVESCGTDYLVLEVEGYRELPVVCRRNNSNLGLRCGDIWFRPRGKPRSERISNDNDMRELLEVAAENAARRIVRDGMAAGMLPPAAPNMAAQYNRELGGL